MFFAACWVGGKVWICQQLCVIFTQQLCENWSFSNGAIGLVSWLSPLWWKQSAETALNTGSLSHRYHPLHSIQVGAGISCLFTYLIVHASVYNLPFGAQSSGHCGIFFLGLSCGCGMNFLPRLQIYSSFYQLCSNVKVIIFCRSLKAWEFFQEQTGQFRCFLVYKYKLFGVSADFSYGTITCLRKPRLNAIMSHFTQAGYESLPKWTEFSLAKEAASPCSSSLLRPVVVFRRRNSSLSLLCSAVFTHLHFSRLYSVAPSTNIKSLSSRQAHVVFQPMNKLPKRSCLAPWETLAQACVGDSNEQPHARGCAHAIVCVLVQPVLRFQGRVSARRSL